MRKLHGGLIAAAAMAVIGGIAGTGAQSATPYKLGMFEQNGRQLRRHGDSRHAGRGPVARQCRRAGHAEAADRRLSDARTRRHSSRRSPRKPRDHHSGRQLKTLPPIPDPTVLLNAAVNYSEHGIEMTGQATVAASADKVDPKVAMGIPSLLDPQAGRSAA